MAGSLASINNSVLWALSNHTNALASLQEQAATGKRINRVSDDPSDSHRLLALQSQERVKDSYMKGIDDVVNFLEISSSVLQNMSDKITDVRQVVTSVLSAIHSQNQDTKASAAEGIDMILEDIVSMVNWQHRGQYLFGGANSAQAPYQVSRENGSIADVQYRGAMDERTVEINEDLRVKMNSVGLDLFSLGGSPDPEIFGSTGAQPGTATSSFTGNTWMDVETIAGGYRLSIDGGASWTNVTVPPGDANTAVSDSKTGHILYIDSTSITQPGSDMVRVQGTHDIFDVLITMRDLLENSRNLSIEEQDNLIQATVADFESLHEKVTQGLMVVGSKLGSLDGIRESVENAKLDAQEEASLVGDADIAQLSVDLARRETLYQMSISIAARLFSISILDYM